MIGRKSFTPPQTPNPGSKALSSLFMQKPRAKSLPGSREHNECPMRSASPPCGNFSESFHTVERNLSHERPKAFTPTSQTFRSPAPNPFTQSPETCHFPEPQLLRATILIRRSARHWARRFRGGCEGPRRTRRVTGRGVCQKQDKNGLVLTRGKMRTASLRVGRGGYSH